MTYQKYCALFVDNGKYIVPDDNFCPRDYQNPRALSCALELAENMAFLLIEGYGTDENFTICITPASVTRVYDRGFVEESEECVSITFLPYKLKDQLKSSDTECKLESFSDDIRYYLSGGKELALDMSSLSDTFSRQGLDKNCDCWPSLVLPETGIATLALITGAIARNLGIYDGSYSSMMEQKIVKRGQGGFLMSHEFEALKAGQFKALPHSTKKIVQAIEPSHSLIGQINYDLRPENTPLH